MPASGTNAALPLGSFGGNDFGLHPGAAALHELFQDGRVAFVHGCGMNTDSRSHFDTQAQIELGTPGVGSTANGWLTRHFLSAGLPPGIVMPSLAVSSTIQTAFQGSLEVVAMTNRDDFLLNTGPSDWRDEQKAALRNILESNGVDPLYTKGDRGARRLDPGRAQRPLGRRLRPRPTARSTRRAPTATRSS